MGRQPIAATLRLVFDIDQQDDVAFQTIIGLLTDVRRLYSYSLELAHPDYEQGVGSTDPRKPQYQAAHVKAQHRLLVSRIRLESPFDLTSAIPAAAGTVGVLWATAQLVDYVYNFPLRRRNLEAETRLREFELEDRLAERERARDLDKLRQRASRGPSLLDGELDATDAGTRVNGQ